MTTVDAPHGAPSADSFGITRIAIVNRGEAAMRLVNAVRELRVERAIDLRTIALHTRAEQRAMFVREADEAVCIDDGRPADAGNAYLDLAALERALIDARADAAWVGWGFVAERPAFAELCARIGVVFIGPKAEVMRVLGDKIEAKRLAEAAEVPVAPWSGGPVDTVDDARLHADRIGFPLMIKATAGGGGRGIRRVDAHDGLAEAFESARSEGLKAFGDPTVFMERVVAAARHVEVQIIADHHGNVWAAGVRDCSLQRRNQKVIEESHCVALTPDQDRDLRAASVRLARLAGYENAGTVEFLYQPDEQRFAFLEVNTRLQVEHPVTELTTGLDLVKLQITVAAGERLVGEAPAADGYAIEARLNAEDPVRGFAPAPGTVSTLTLPVGPGIRVDTGIAEGDVIPPEYDSMIAKVIAHGRNRPEALSRLHRALAQMTVLVDGGTTNRSFLLDLLDRPEVRDATIDTSWLDRLTASGGHLTDRLADVALVAAAVDAAELQAAIDRAAFLGWASRGRPAADLDIGHEIELRHGARSYRVTVRQLANSRFECELHGSRVIADVVRLGRARTRLTIGDRAYQVVSSAQDQDHLVEVDGVAHRFSRDDAGVVRAPSAALVVGVDVSVDSVVEIGDRLATVEAMKMELAIAAPVAGRVGAVFVARNVQVVAGAPLFRIEQAGDGDGGGDDSMVITFDDLASRPAVPPVTAVDLVRAAILGFDIDPGAARRAVAGPSIDRHDPALVDLLDVFADLTALEPERSDADSDDLRGAREWFDRFLRSLDATREGLPPRYADRLLRALGHYGVATLDRSPALEQALLRIFLSRQRRDDHAALVVALLEGGIALGGRESLDRLIDATRRRRPVIASMARALRYREFDRPLIEQARAEISETMWTLAARLVGGDAGAGDAERLVACPLPLVPILAEHGLVDGDVSAAPLLEVLTKRYYKIRELGPVSVQPLDDVELVRTSYAHHERNVHVVAVRSTIERLAATLGAVAAAAGEIRAPETMVVDLYLTSLAESGDAGGDDDTLSAQLDAALREHPLPAAVRRIAAIPVRVGTRSRPLTFRRAGDDGVRPYWMASEPEETGTAYDPTAFEEDVKFRGLHPMIARRLHMWRLSNFEISPMPAPGDVNLFHCVARGDSSDVRLIAVAEIRDATPTFDDDGSVRSLPEFEHVFAGCLEAIRRARASVPGGETLEWNRVMLYVWPVVDLPIEQLDAVARRFAPMTEGLGLEQIVVSGRLSLPGVDEPVEAVMRFANEPGQGVTVRITDPPSAPMTPVDDYTRKVIQTRRRGLMYPYEIAGMLRGPGGSFVEHDLDDSGALVPVDREPGLNRAGVVVGVVTTPTAECPEGITRVAVLGDPTKAMGSITEAECSRLLAAIDLAEAMDVPIEWFALSAGAKIAMDSGSENLDWVARVLRRLVEHTQAGGEVNIVVAGINVGAQPYWNAEATMLMHTKGILVMTPESAMVLTGKQAIDYSGGVSADDNLGIGGYERIMGPNGEAQYWAASLPAARDLLFDHYRLTYRHPRERWPRTVATADPHDRDVRAAVHAIDGVEFTTVGDVFSAEANPDRKKPFDIRTVMNAVLDADHEPLERWPEMAEAEMAVVYEARLGGHSVTLIGMESRPMPRHGVTPADGPAQWSAGTLFPLSSKKIARAINAASGSRPVVVLANLSGFDGSPESLRRLQLEYGAEIGRAIVNFDGPIVLCVISRYHGGAFVVFSSTLNDEMEVLAVEGSFASVIGGAPAAAVVFTRDVDQRTRSDDRVRAAEQASAEAPENDLAARQAELATIREAVRVEKLGEVAAEFDATHSVQRALDVGSVHRIIAAGDMRSELIAAVRRGLERSHRG